MENFILTAEEYADYRKSMKVIRKFNRLTDKNNQLAIKELQNAYKIQEEIFNKPRKVMIVATKNIAVGDVVTEFALKPIDK